MSDIDLDKNSLPVSARERLIVKLILLIVKMIYPARWSSDLDKALADIKDSLK